MNYEPQKPKALGDHAHTVAMDDAFETVEPKPKEVKRKGPRLTIGGKPVTSQSFLERQRVEMTENIEQNERMNRAQRREYFRQVKKAAKKRGAWK